MKKKKKVIKKNPDKKEKELITDLLHKEKEQSELKKQLSYLDNQKKKLLKKYKKEEDKEKKNKNYNPLYDKKFSFKSMKNALVEAYSPGSVVLINMELNNGMHTMFLVVESDQGFKYKKKKYLFDYNMKYYNLSCKMYAYDYHEGLSLPVKRTIPYAEIRDNLEEDEQVQVEYSINPATLERFVISKIAEGVMKGQELANEFKLIKLFIIITMGVVLIHFLIFIYTSGLLQGLRG